MGHGSHDLQPSLEFDFGPTPGAEHGRPGDPSEPVVVLTPAGPGGHPRARGMRVVGPGRRERAYQDRIGALSTALDSAHRELEEASLVERGTGRYVDRVEAELVAAREREEEARQQLNRTLVLLGATQREVEGLRLALERALQRSLTAAAPSGWLARLVHRLRG